MYEQYLIRLLAPLSLYNLRAPHNGGELAALGGELDSVSGLVELVERESLLATAESEGLDRREVLFAHKPAAVTQEDRREAIAALLRISEDGLTPEAINDTLTGCGIRARAEEKADGSLRVVFPRTAGVWGDRIFEKCGIRRDEGGDGGKTLEIRGKQRLSARDEGANYQQS